jgi:DNA-binding response OmpR family regulator
MPYCETCGQPLSFKPSALQIFGIHVAYKGASTEVSGTQLSVMRVLLRWPAWLTPSERIIEEVWGENGNRALLTATITGLRRRLRRIGLNVGSKYGVGYRLEELDSKNLVRIAEAVGLTANRWTR